MLLIKFRFIWESCFRGEDFLEINQSETRIACGGHVYTWIGTKLALDRPKRGNEILIVHCCFSVSQNEPLDLVKILLL
jgi:hypothetical protein